MRPPITRPLKWDYGDNYSERPRRNEAMTRPDFRDLEASLDQFLAIGLNAAGYPIARPTDCLALTLAFQEAFEQAKRLFETGHQETISRFFELLTRYKQSALRGYGAEMARAEFLEARVLTVIGRHDASAAIVSRWGERPYRFDGEYRLIIQALSLDLNARLAAGRVEEAQRLALARVLYLASAGGLWRAFGMTRRFYQALSLGPWRGHVRHWTEPVLVAASHLCVWQREVGRRHLLGRRVRWLVMMVGLLVADLLLAVAGLFGETGLSLQAESDPAVAPPPLRGAADDQIPAFLVTRPTGGLGDLLMMTPGLRALARRYGRPVAFAIPTRFHHAFVDDPDFKLLDSDSFIDLSRYRRWRNLGLCPAAHYEAGHAPRITKGRVELFARGMGVTRRELVLHGDKPKFHLSATHDIVQAETRGLARTSGRPLIGVALHSREAYRDYPAMPQLLVALAERYTVLAIHSTPVALPASPHIIGWFDRPLHETVAAMAACDVIVSVDTALYHFAGALNVPAVAVFGPTSAAIRSLHIARKVIVEAEGFACQPCWRNEDELCQMSGDFSSVCMASIGVERVATAIEAALLMRKGPAVPKL
jgi:hypothetical protein